MRHAANSAAALGEPAARLDMIRCGIAIYGMDPFHRDPADHGLEPALELVSYVAEVKRARAGESAGYGRRFVAERDTWIGTIPIGYGDGFRRGLTGRVDVLVGGRRVPGVGTVSMDNITVDLGDEPVERGTEAVLLGARGGERILAEDWPRALGTINYEITCGISPRGAAELTRERGARAPRATALAGEDGVARRRRGARPAARARHRRRRPRDPGRPEAARAQDRARGRAARRSSSAARSAPGAWSGREHAWHVDLVTLRDDDIHADLAQRDFTINAMAEPLGGGELLDPHGGRDDLAQRLVRMVSPQALADDPLRSLRGDPDRGRARTSSSTPRPARRRPANAPGDRAASRPSGCSPSSSASSRADAVRRGLALMDGARADRRRPARADRAARDRAEPLPPRRRPRPHARGARRRSRCCSAIRRPRARRRGDALLAEPLVGRAHARRRRCAGPRSCTTPPSRRPATSCPTGG